MLDMGFEPQIRNVLKAIQGDKQVLMFSATWPTDVKVGTTKLINNSIKVTLGELPILFFSL